MKLGSLQVLYLLVMLMQVNQQPVVILCILWELLMPEQFKNIKKKLKKKVETPGGWPTLWILMKRKRLKVKQLK
jgi:hypothetical protein